MSRDLTDLLALNNFKENDKRVLACFIWLGDKYIRRFIYVIAKNKGSIK